MKHFENLAAYFAFVIALFVFVLALSKVDASTINNDRQEITEEITEAEESVQNTAVIGENPKVYIPCDTTTKKSIDRSDTDDARRETEESEPKEIVVNENELEMLACTIYIEAGGDTCSDETRMMVGNVVLNRIADDRFPDTMEEVLLQPRQYNTFSWTGIQWPASAEDESESSAVSRAYECARKLLEGERVLDADVVWQAEFVQGTEIVSFQDGIYFCR